MGTEIERKFLVTDTRWKSRAAGVPVRQGYLGAGTDCVVRVRIMGGRATMTIKGRTVGATRPEFEYDIPLDDGLQLLELCGQTLVEKTRYRVEHGGLTWEIDEFHGANAGLVVAECELESETQEIDKPAWVAEEVTGDPRYYNSNLAVRPFTTW